MRQIIAAPKWRIAEDTANITVLCVQQFHVEYTIVCFMMLCKIHSLILGNWGIDSYATSGLVGFKIGFGR